MATKDVLLVGMRIKGSITNQRSVRNIISTRKRGQVMCSNCSGDYEEPLEVEERDELQTLLEACWNRQQAVKNAHSSWNATRDMLKELPFEVAI
jgi:hypothetical protein